MTDQSAHLALRAAVPCRSMRSRHNSTSEFQDIGHRLRMYRCISRPDIRTEEGRSPPECTFSEHCVSVRIKQFHFNHNERKKRKKKEKKRKKKRKKENKRRKRKKRKEKRKSLALCALSVFY